MKDKLEPQQPEGKLVENPYKCVCKLVRRMSDAEADEDYASHKFDAGRQAQLAHCQTTMVKIDWLFEPCPHSTDPLFLATRHECDECMEELTRQRSE